MVMRIKFYNMGFPVDFDDFVFLSFQRKSFAWNLRRSKSWGKFSEQKKQSESTGVATQRSDRLYFLKEIDIFPKTSKVRHVKWQIEEVLKTQETYCFYDIAII